MKLSVFRQAVPVLPVNLLFPERPPPPLFFTTSLKKSLGLPAFFLVFLPFSSLKTQDQPCLTSPPIDFFPPHVAVFISFFLSGGFLFAPPPLPIFGRQFPNPPGSPSPFNLPRRGTPFSPSSLRPVTGCRSLRRLQAASFLSMCFFSWRTCFSFCIGFLSSDGKAL